MTDAPKPDDVTAMVVRCRSMIRRITADNAQWLIDEQVIHINNANTGAAMTRGENATLLTALAAARAENGKLRAILCDAVALYGRPGGPWNIPSDPGGWLDRARAALEQGGGDGR